MPRDWVDPEGWTNSALREIDALEHPVVVLHDLNTGAMRALPKFLDDLLNKGMQFTLDLPESCVPFRRGLGCRVVRRQVHNLPVLRRELVGYLCLAVLLVIKDMTMLK